MHDVMTMRKLLDFRTHILLSAATLTVALFLPASAGAVVIDITVDGGDAIFLAGRTDLVIPAANLPWPGGMIRHGGATPEEILETLPPSLAVTAGDVIRVADPAVGGVNFFNGLGPPFFGPGGDGLSGSNLFSFGGISGYIGPQGPLTGVFLDNNVPNVGPAPATLDFSPAGLGIDFPTLSPALGQIFYIGDGVSGAVFQEFTAPVGATRLFLGIPDGFGFVNGPGAYDDNDGAYRVRIGINEVPTVAEPASLTLLGIGFGILVLRRKLQSPR
jgi:hypothetical protein